MRAAAFTIAAVALLAAAVPAAGAAAPARASDQPAAGTFLWQAPLLGPGSGSFMSPLARGPAGSVYTVFSSGSSDTQREFAVLRVRASDGTELWRTGYQGPGNVWAEAHSLATEPDGDVILLGGQKAMADGAESWVLQRYRAADGKLLWSVVKSSQDATGTATTTSASGLDTDAAGNVYVAGYTGAGEDDPGVGIAVKYSPAGKELWERTVTAPRGSDLNDIVVDARGDSYVTGALFQTESGPDELVLGAVLRLDPSGHVVWSHPLGSGGFFQTHSVVLRGRSVYVSGLQWVEADPETQGWPFVAKLSRATGEKAWMTSLSHIPGSIQQDMGFAVDRNGNAFIGGLTFMYGESGSQNPGSSGWVYKLGASDGAPAWNHLVSGDAGSGRTFGMLWTLAVDGRGRVYCGGTRATDSSGDVEAIVMRYDAAGGSPTLWRFNGGGAGKEGGCYALLARDGVFAAGALETSTGAAGFLERLKP